MNPLSTELTGQDFATDGRKSARAPRRKGVSPVGDAVIEVLDNLIRVMQRHGGLLPSCLDLETHGMPAADPGILPGQRSWDRALTGCNLMHDMPLLGLLYSLAETQGRSDYQSAADACLETFLSRCTQTTTGLFPWGEHAFWDLREERLGDSLKAAWPETAANAWRNGLPEPAWHDHLRQAPPWFWEKVGKISPGVLQRFADGLDGHWVTEDRDEYNRHGGIDRAVRLGRNGRSCDFPRHSGFYVLDLACAWRQERRPETLEQMRRYADYWWNKRRGEGCLRVESRSPARDADFFDILCPSQTLSLAVSLMDASRILQTAEPSVSDEFLFRGRTYGQSYLDAPHVWEDGRLVGGYRDGTGKTRKFLPVFGSVYGVYSQPQAALLCCAAYRHLGEVRLLDLARAAARACLRHSDMLCEKPKEGEKRVVPALDAGLAMELMADLYELTGEVEWLDAGRMLWPVIEERYFHNGLVRLTDGGGWYEAQQGTGFLLHGVARFALISELASPIPPDYSAR